MSGFALPVFTRQREKNIKKREIEVISHIIITKCVLNDLPSLSVWFDDRIPQESLNTLIYNPVKGWLII